MKRKKWFLVGAVCVSLAFSLETQAVGIQDNVNIGFSIVRTPSPPEGPKEDIIPLTSGGKTTYISRQSLPKTGESLSTHLQLIGISCLLISFWLFLFLQLKKEGQDEN